MSDANNKETPLVSIVIPAYNHEQFIEAAVDSVLNQTVTDLELIVIDDGSTDRTGEIVRGYSDCRLSYYHQENQDAFNTINRGLDLAKGRFVAILNSDDAYTPNRLERLLKRQQQTSAECIISDVIPISDQGIEFTDPDFGWNLWHKKNRDFYFASGDIYTAFLKGNFMVTTSNLFMTAKAVKKVGKFCSLRYLHDYDFIFRLMLAFPQGVHYFSEEKLLYYRIHDGNTLSEAAVLGREQDQQVIKQYMIAKIDKEWQQYVQAGSERLIELGDELHEVKCTLEPDQPQGVRPAFQILLKRLHQWIEKKIR